MKEEDIKEYLFLKHSHAEIEFDMSPSQIVYKEKDILELLNKLGYNITFK